MGNLAWRTSWQDLKDEFRKCGNVVYANVMRTEDGEKRGRVAGGSCRWCGRWAVGAAVWVASVVVG